MPDSRPAVKAGTTCQNETARKLLHLAALAMPLTYYLLPKSLSTGLIAAAFVISLLIDLARLRGWPIQRFWSKALDPILRPSEANGFSGATFILFSGWLTPILYEQTAATMGMTAIILGDTAAALIGRRWGTHRFGSRGRSWEGSCAFLAASSIGALLIPTLTPSIGIGCAIVATIVEASSSRIDDNLSVPLVTGLVANLLLRM